MRIAPVPELPEIRLYAAHPASGLWRLTHQDGQAAEPEEEGTEADEFGPEPQPPYWAYAWAGGAVLARYILDRPETVAGLRVLDLGAGSGLVGIVAAKAGASQVIASEIDRNGVAALALNAAANGVAVTVVGEDITAG
ncbi:MAG: methyltransferase, partial [Mesorhizobium sp.]